MSVKGALSLCHISVDVAQYKLVRGLLGYNLGECTDDLNDPPDQVWSLGSFEVSCQVLRKT